MNEPAVPRKHARILPPSATLACTRLLGSLSANAAKGSLCLSLCAVSPANLDPTDESTAWRKLVSRLVSVLQQQLNTLETSSDLLRAHSEGDIGGAEPLAFYLDLNLLSNPPRPGSHKAKVLLPGEAPKRRGRPRKILLASATPPATSPAAPVASTAPPVPSATPPPPAATAPSPVAPNPAASPMQTKSKSKKSIRLKLPYLHGRPS